MILCSASTRANIDINIYKKYIERMRLIEIEILFHPLQTPHPFYGFNRLLRNYFFDLIGLFLSLSCSFIIPFSRNCSRIIKATFIFNPFCLLSLYIFPYVSSRTVKGPFKAASNLLMLLLELLLLYLCFTRLILVVSFDQLFP